MLTSHFSKPSILALNAVLLDAPEVLNEAFADETVELFCHGITDDVRTKIASSVSHRY